MTKVIVGSPVWSLNGVNVFCADLAAGLRDRGIDAGILLTGVTYRERKPLPLPRDVPVTQLSIPRHATWSARRRALRDYLIANAPCVYFPNHDFNHSCITASLTSRVAVIGIVHSDDEQHYDHFRRVGTTWNAVVAVSSRIHEKLLVLSCVAADRIHTVPYGVTTSEARRSHNDRQLRIIYTGRLDETQKHVSDLIRIAQKLEARGVGFDMSIVGDGPERQRLERAVEAAALSQRIRLTGAVERSRAVELCAEHDVFLLPSSYEGMPLSLLEAMGQGCIPVVRKSESGIPELVTDGVNGIVIDGNDSDAFAAAIERIARDSELRRNMSHGAVATIASGQFRSGVMISKYIELIESAATEARAGTFHRTANASCPRLSLRDVIAAPLWSLRPSMRTQHSITGTRASR